MERRHEICRQWWASCGLPMMVVPLCSDISHSAHVSYASHVSMPTVKGVHREAVLQ